MGLPHEGRVNDSTQPTAVSTALTRVPFELMHRLLLVIARLDRAIQQPPTVM